jgi:hypothetical protein
MTVDVAVRLIMTKLAQRDEIRDLILTPALNWDDMMRVECNIRLSGRTVTATGLVTY